MHSASCSHLTCAIMGSCSAAKVLVRTFDEIRSRRDASRSSQQRVDKASAAMREKHGQLKFRLQLQARHTAQRIGNALTDVSRGRMFPILLAYGSRLSDVPCGAHVPP